MLKECLAEELQLEAVQNDIYEILKIKNPIKAVIDYVDSKVEMHCPRTGSFLGYKISGNCMVTIIITVDSLRSSAFTNKCRASKVRVMRIQNIETNEFVDKATNTGDFDFTYEVGKVYEIKDFDTNRFNQCSSGIHFFMTKEEAFSYYRKVNKDL